MDELRRRLREVMKGRYGNSARKTSEAAGLDPNQVGLLLRNPNRLPTIDTLDKFREAFGWPLEDMVYWALKRQRPAPGEGEPRQIITEQLIRLEVRDTDIQWIMEWLDRVLQLAREERPSNDPS